MIRWIYYPISLAVCTLLTYSKQPILILPYLGIMAMAWGDGMAAVVGKKMPIKIIRPGKSIGGSSTFSIFTLVSSFIYLFTQTSQISFETIFVYSLVTATIGGIVELVSSKNLDNLTVPIFLGLVGFLVGI